VIRGEVETEGGVARAGDIIFHPMQRYCSEYSQTPGIHEWIEFKDLLWPRLEQGLIFRAGCLYQFEELQVVLSRGNHFEISSKFYALLAAYRELLPAELVTCRTTRFEPVIQYINTHFAKMMSRDDLASIASMNPNAFDRAFRRECGQSPMQLLRSVRIREARQRILRSQDTIEMIAVQCGFPSGAYLSRCFKKEYSMSPSGLRLCVNKTSYGYYRDAVSA
jgi:AraC-like DNA-binding protein